MRLTRAFASKLASDESERKTKTGYVLLGKFVSLISSHLLSTTSLKIPFNFKLLSDLAGTSYISAVDCS